MIFEGIELLEETLRAEAVEAVAKLHQRYTNVYGQR